MDDARKDRSGEERVVSRGFRCAVGGGARSERVLAGDERVSIETRSAFRGVVPPRERTLSPVRSAFASSPEVEEEPSAFHWMLFLDFFSIKPIPSRTLVMSYIRRFCTCRDSAARFRSIVPSSACSIRVTNFFVSKLSELNVVCGGRKSKGQRPEGFGGNFSGIADAASGEEAKGEEDGDRLVLVRVKDRLNTPVEKSGHRDVLINFEHELTAVRKFETIWPLSH